MWLITSIRQVFGADPSTPSPLRAHLVKSTAKAQGSPPATAPSDTDVFNYLMKTGLDYKGQANCAHQAMGGGGTVKGKWRALGLPTFLTTRWFGAPSMDIEGTLDAKLANARFILIEHQDDDISAHPNTAPLCVSSMHGYRAEVGVNVAFDVTVLKIDWGKKKTTPSPDPATPSTAPTPAPEPPEPPLPWLLEKCGFAASASMTVGASVTGGTRCTRLSVSDPLPAWFRKGSRSEVATQVRRCLENKEVVPGTEGWGFEPRSSLTLWMPEGSGGAGASASFKIDRSLFNKTFAQSASGKADAKVDLTIKMTSYRLSTWSYSSVIKTQDTRISYKQAAFKGFGVSGKVETTIDLKPAEPKPSKGGAPAPVAEETGDALSRGINTVSEGLALNQVLNIEKSVKDGLALKATVLDPKKTAWTTNSMDYESTIAYWHARDATTLLPGSGYVLGTSLTVANLAAYYEALQVLDGIERYIASGEEHEDHLEFMAEKWRVSALIDDYEEELGAKLRVPRADIERALASDVVKDLVGMSTSGKTSSGPVVGAILIEAAFSVSSRSGWLTPIVRRANTATTNVFPSIADEMRAQLGDTDDWVDFSNLESIRVRYRMSDVATTEKPVEFPLGLHVLAEEKLGITLQTMSRLGSEGIFDVATFWKGELASFAGPTRGGPPIPRGSVPPVVLLT